MIVCKTDIYSIDKNMGEFLGGPVIELGAFTVGTWVQFLVWELRSYILHGAAKKKKKERENVRNECFHTMWQLYNL